MKERSYHRFQVPGARLCGPAFDAPVVNLSKTGLAIVTSQELEPGASFSAWLERGKDRSRVEGRVVWCAPRYSEEAGTVVSFEAGLSVHYIEPEAAGVGEAEVAVESKAGGEAPPATPPEPSPQRRTRVVRGAPRVDVTGMRLRAGELDAEVVNFSSRGLAIRVDRPLDTGRIYQGKLETPDGAVFLKAIVVWSNRRVRADGVAGSVAGLSLSEVDQRLDPLAPSFVPPVEEPDAIEWPGADAAPSESATDEAEPESPESESAESESVELDSADLDSADLDSVDSGSPESGPAPPWLAEVTDESFLDPARPAYPLAALRWGAVVVLVAAVGASGVWLGGRRPQPESSLDSSPTTAPSRPRASANLEPSVSDASASSIDRVAWQAPGSPAETPSDESAAPLDGPAGAPATESRGPLPLSPLGVLVPRAGVNVRGGPGVGYPIVRRTRENERLPFVERQGEWFRLQADTESWVHAVTVVTLSEASRPASGAAESKP